MVRMVRRAHRTLLLVTLAFWPGWSVARAAAAEPLPTPDAAPRQILLDAIRFDTRLGEPALPAELTATPGASDVPDYWIVQFDAPVGRADRQRVAAVGGQVVSYIPHRALLVRASAASLDRLRADPAVVFVGRYQPAYRLAPAIGSRTFADPARQRDPRLWLTVDVFAGESPEAVAAAMRVLGAEVVDVDVTPLVRRLKVRAAPGLLDDLARLRAVAWIEEWGEFTLRNDTTRWVVQSNLEGVTSLWDHGLLGQGQIAGHIDSRIKLDSCYFEDPAGNPPGPDHRKIVAYHSSTGPGEGSHGTHTAGTIAGDQEPVSGETSGNGMAPLARIAHTNWADITGYDNTTSNLAESLTEAHLDGAHVHTNSWGDDGHTEYTTWARDIDLFSRLFEDDLVGFAVTNTSSLKTPENAKNVLAVGASYQAPEQHRHSSGGAGPTIDGRRKPELYAPGRQIRSARLQPCDTITSSGTSMACPAVMGGALLVRQYYVEGWYPGGVPDPANAITPSGALLRATLLNATVDMDPPGYPTDTEGWGRLLLEDALHFAGDARDLQVWDVRHAAGLETGEVREFSFDTVTGSEPLRVTMVFTDEPAALGAAYAPVNDLDLEVTWPFGSYLGNMLVDGWSVPGGTPDPLNNVEMVLIENPGASHFVVRVHGTQVAGAEPQGFALVVTGDLAGDTAAIGAAEGSARPGDRPRLVALEPNPMNPATTIDYVLPVRAPLSIAVHDAAGRRLRTLVRDVQSAGPHRLRWDGRDASGQVLASGVYLIRLEQGNRTLDVRKAVLVR
ncbi:MAG: S8 family serine peptidase [Candidatus Eiseniibacteriota bacterium]|jgi:subtilisin family serine protease